MKKTTDGHAAWMWIPRNRDRDRNRDSAKNSDVCHATRTSHGYLPRAWTRNPGERLISEGGGWSVWDKQAGSRAGNPLPSFPLCDLEIRNPVYFICDHSTHLLFYHKDLFVLSLSQQNSDRHSTLPSSWANLAESRVASSRTSNAGNLRHERLVVAGTVQRS